jgi:branched-chain amino acid transport system ATP-binding protein
MRNLLSRPAAQTADSSGGAGLTVSDLHVSYGPIKAITGISLTVPERGIVAVLGANGAGKSTLLRAVSGLQRAAAGSIVFNGLHLERLSPDAIVRHGVVQVPEDLRRVRVA